MYLKDAIKEILITPYRANKYIAYPSLLKERHAYVCLGKAADTLTLVHFKGSVTSTPKGLEVYSEPLLESTWTPSLNELIRGDWEVFIAPEETKQ